MKKVISVAALLVFSGMNLMASELYLKNGEIVKNEIVNVTNSSYIVKDGNQWREISKDEVSFVKEDTEGRRQETKNEKRTHPELIVKAGFNFTNELNSYDNTNGNASYNSSDSIFFGADLFVPVISNIYLGAGVKTNLNSSLKSGYGYFSSIPFFASVKLQNQLNEKIKVYTSFNLGTSFIESTDEFMADNGINSADKGREYTMKPYYGLNFGVDMNRVIIELGFSYEAFKVKGGNVESPDDMNIVRTGLAIGYRI